MKLASLSEIVEEHGGLIQTGPFGSQLHQTDYSEIGVPVVMPKDIKNGRVDESTIARIPEGKARELTRHSLRAGSVVFPRRGEISKCAYINEEQAGFLCGTGCIKIEPPEHRLRSKFLSYYLSLPQCTEWLERNAVGTTMLNLNTKILGRLKIPDFSIKHQDSIIGILFPYDDLIGNNRRRIQLLEQSARLLYKEWFVHLRFPGHEHVKIKDGVPEGWQRKKIVDVWNVSYGKNLPTKMITSSGKYPVHGADGIIGYYNEKNVDRSLCLVTCRGNGTGNVRRTFGPTFVTNNCFVLYPKLKPEALKFHYAIFAMEALRLQELKTGAAQPQLTISGIKHLNISVPSDFILKLYNSYIDPIYDQIDSLRIQNEKLAQARDILLPRLMNGEIAV